jgi:hypothetical protein
MNSPSFNILEQLIKKNKKIINNENNKEKQKNPSEIE